MCALTVDTVYGTSDPIPYDNVDIPYTQFTQSADVLFIVHPNYPPATLSRYGANDWRYEYPVFEHGPYLPREVGDDEISLSLTAVTDRLTLTSTEAAEWTGLSVDDLVEYAIANQRVLGKIVTTGTNSIVVEPLESRSLVLAKEVYSPGLYTGWDGTNSIPTYNTTITGSNVDVAFSNSQVATRSTIGNYLRFSDKAGTYYWMLVDSVSDILEQGAYGIIAKGDILTVHVPTGTVSRSNRAITGTLTSTETDFFDLYSIGRLYRLVLNDTVIHCRGTAYTSGTQITVSMSGTVPYSGDGTQRVLDSNTTDWNKGAWFTGNYPATVTIFEERLTFGGTALQPQTFNMSKSGDYYDFATTDAENRVMDDSAIDVTIASDSVNALLWMAAHQVLLAGTLGSEWMISASSNRDAITPTNLTANQQSSYGSEFAKALVVGHSIFYIQRGGQKMREMLYDYSTDRYSSMDITVFAEHIFRDHGGATAMAYQHLPESVLYVLCADGQVCALTYEPDQKVYSWSRIVLGGPQATVTSIATKLEDNESVLYMTVKRYVNSAWVYSVEKLVPTYEPDSATDFTDMVFLDSYAEIDLNLVEVDGDVITVRNGLDIFYGQTVTALIDNVPYADLVVSSDGVLTLPTQPAERLIVGYQYDSVFKSFPLETGGRRGTTQGKIKTISNFTLRCRNTIGFSHGWALNALKTEPVPSPLAHQTEDVRVPLPNNYDTRGAYYVVQDKAYPLTILALFPEPALHQ